MERLERGIYATAMDMRIKNAYEEIEDEEVPKAEPNPATNDISFAVVMASQVAAFTLGGIALGKKKASNK